VTYVAPKIPVVTLPTLASTAAPVVQTASGAFIGVMVGGAIGFVLMIAIIVVLAIQYRKLSKKDYRAGDGKSPGSETVT
jgi:hypothetical protein